MTARPSTAAPILAVLAIVALLLPVFYVLGVGPTAWLVINGYISNDSAMAFYWPLQSLADSSPLVDSILQGYVSLPGSAGRLRLGCFVQAARLTTPRTLSQEVQ